MKFDPVHRIFMPILAIIIVSGVFYLMREITIHPIDPSQKDIIVYVLGFLSGLSMLVVSYYFGSSNQQERRGTDAEKTNANRNKAI